MKPTDSTNTSRRRQIERVRELLLRRGMPRLQMSLILFVTGLSGFLVSFVLLHVGVREMWFRYPFAVLVAYIVFLLLLRLWLLYQKRSARRSSSGLDLSDVDLAIPFDAGGNAAGEALDEGFGGGADFAGAGAGGGWEPSLQSATASPSVAGGGGSGSGGGGGVGLPDIGIDADEGCFFAIALLLIIVSGLLASLYVIYIAPALLAEMLVDGLLVSGLYRRVKDPVPGNWLLGVVRQTLVPVLLVFACFLGAGYLFNKIAPEASTIREVWRSIASD